jgi:hypothetical protein
MTSRDRTFRVFQSFWDALNNAPEELDGALQSGELKFFVTV